MRDDEPDWVEINRKYSEDFDWPVIVEQKDPLPDADQFNPVMGYDGPSKLDELDETPGDG